MTKRACKGTTKAGKPCKSTAVGADGYCFVHGSSSSLQLEVARKAGIASGEARRELGRSMRQRLAERLEQDVEEIYAVFKQAWGEGDWRAADAAISQALGRPPLAIVGDDEQPIAFHVVSAFAADVDA